MEFMASDVSTPPIAPLVAASASGAKLAPPATEGRAWKLGFFAIAALMALFLLLRPVYYPYPPDHYVYLAHHLALGDLTVDNLPLDYGDYVNWNGHKYLPLGPLPGIVLIPFLPLLDAGLQLAWIGHLFTLLSIWLLYRVLRRLQVPGEHRKWAILLSFGGTVYYSGALMGTAWYFAHIVAITCLLVAISAALGGRRTWLVGLFLGLAAMTRLTMLFALPFFLWILWRGTGRAGVGVPPSSRFAALTLLSLGLAGPLVLLFGYNYARFGNPLESGYGLAVMGGPVLGEALAYGLFSPVHIPKNLFMLLLQGPLPYPSADAPVLKFPYIQPTPWGMGIFFTSPAFVCIFKARRSDPLVQACWLGVIFVMAPIITYYGIGWVQFGFRYALDFTLFLLLLTVCGWRGSLSNLVRGLVLLSVLINLLGGIWLMLV
ncbi:MAG TPA: hypothetical protein VF276_19250 [Chloroflexia bacterium]